LIAERFRVAEPKVTDLAIDYFAQVFWTALRRELAVLKNNHSQGRRYTYNSDWPKKKKSPGKRKCEKTNSKKRKYENEDKEKTNNKDKEEEEDGEDFKKKNTKKKNI